MCQCVRLQPVTQKKPSAALLTRRGLLIFALIWQAAWMVTDVSLWPSRQSNAIESILILLTWVTWLFTLVALFTSRRANDYPRYLSMIVRINIVALGLSAISLSLLSIDPTVNDWIVSASIFNLVAGVAGASIRNPEQWFWVFGLVITEFLIFIAFGFSFAEEMQFSSVVLYPLYALAIGVAAASAQKGLVNGADRAELAQRLAVDREVQVQLAHESERQTAATQARVHETVLNTLTAIARGGLPNTSAMEKQVTARCSEAALVLRDVLEPLPEHFSVTETGLFGAISDVITEMGNRGISVSLEGDTGLEIPRKCEAAIVASVREALNNVMRHSQSSHVIIRVAATNSHNYRVSIEDNGKGFVNGPSLMNNPIPAESEDRRIGYGWSTILGTDLQSSGARAWVEPSPIKGSIVHIEYVRRRNWISRFFQRSSTPTIGLVFPILASWMSFSAINIAVAWNEYSLPVINVFTFALMIAFSVVAVWFSRSGSLPWWMIVVGVVVAFVTYEGEKLARGTAVGGTWSEWSSEAIAAMFLVLAAASTWWAWIAVGWAWMLIQANFPQELIAPGFTLIMLGGILGLVLRRSQRAMDASLVNAARDGVNVSMARYQSQSRMERFVQLDATEAIRLLEGIAMGLLNWRDPEVRYQCAVQEMYVRNIVISGAAASGPIARGVAELARNQRAVVEVIESEPSLCGQSESLVLEFLREIFNHMTESDRARFSMVQDSNQIHLQLVCQLVHDPFSWIHSIEHESGSIEIDHDAPGIYTLMWHRVINSELDGQRFQESLMRGR